MNKSETKIKQVNNRSKEINRDPRCVFPDCERSSYGGARGLCQKHYVGCTYQVKHGKDTWESLEERGLCNRKMTQDEKNMNQMHPHRTYEQKNPKYDF